jgi:3-oxoacyl-[acyl-carrier protein] reductase
MSLKLEGKIALVTGAGRGIGRSISEKVAAAGAEVICSDLTGEMAEETVAAITAAGGRASAVGIDVSSDEGVRQGIQSLLESHDTIPLLVNNAGVTRDNLLMRMKREEWDFVLNTNLVGTYRMCQALIPSMVKKRYGRIVNVSSVVASMGNAGQTNYAAAKAGIEGFTRSLAREVASRNITVNCVAPGFIDTDMTRDLPEKAREMLLQQVPLKRLGTPGDIASAVLFLLHEDSSYITGTTLSVNGGMVM